MGKEFEFADELGPEKVIEIYDPDTDLKAILVVDNVAAGPAIGGVRMAPDVGSNECFRLARAMTLKNAMAGLAHGGGKSAIVADPDMDAAQKARLVRSFANAIRDVSDYIPGPDMGTNEVSMAQVRAVTGRSVGLPREVGGIPLDEIGATAFGLAIALEVVERHCDLRIDGARVVIEGYGCVGQNAAHFLAERGARIVAVADIRGGRVCPDGFDIEALDAHKNAGNSVSTFEQGSALDLVDLIAVPCDVWIPAARPDTIRRDNVERMDTKVVLQGANIPATLEAEQWLAEHGILVVPDFVANSGGVICASVEYSQGNETRAFETIEEKIRANVDVMLQQSIKSGELPRKVAMDIAGQRVRRAMSFRRT